VAKEFHQQRDLAQAAGVSDATLSRDLRRPDCPLGEPPWDQDDADTYAAWRNTRQHGNAGADEKDPLRRQLIRKTRAMADLNEIKAAKEIGQLVEALEVDRMLARVRSVTTTRLLQVGASVGPLVVGKTEKEAAVLIDDAIRSALRELAVLPAAKPAADDPTDRSEALGGDGTTGEDPAERLG
jgi:predicted DNA binding protein